MKKLILVLLIAGLVSGLRAQRRLLPDVALSTVDGTNVSSRDLLNPGQATLVVFWKSSDGKCCQNLEVMQSAWYDMLREKGVMLIAICEDCCGGWSHIKPLISGQGWDFTVYVDVNGQFRRALGINVLPCSLLFDQDGKILCRYNGFCTGSGEMVCAKVMDYLNLKED